jgi:hypothetical protein
MELASTYVDKVYLSEKSLNGMAKSGEAIDVW